MTISNLRNRPSFADMIADRAWHAWWTDGGMSLADYRAHLDPMMKDSGVPFALVADEGNAYLGSVLLIENDLASRPQYAPWIAALWVEPARRRQGVAGRLIDTARTEAARLGRETCYLCAAPHNWPYYLAHGFRQVEADVEGLGVFVA